MRILVALALSSLVVNAHAEPCADKACFAKTVAACNAKDAAACGDVASMYHDGVVVVRDDHKRITYLTISCQLGAAAVCSELAELYRNGAPGLEQDYARASALYEKACTLGDADDACRRAPVELVGALMLKPEAAVDAALAKAILARAKQLRAKPRDARDATDLDLEIGVALLYAKQAKAAAGQLDAAVNAIDSKDKALLAIAMYARGAARDASGDGGGALADFKQFLTLVDPADPYAVLPLGDPITPSASVAHAQKRVR